MNNFKNIIVENRKKLKLTQRELAEKINVSDKQISKWETGISYPDVTILNSLAKALDISVSELLESDDLKAIEHQDKTDYDLLQNIKSTSFLSISLIFVAFMVFGMGYFISQYAEVVGMIFISISPFVMLFSIIYLIATNMKEQNQIKSHLYEHVYVKSFYFKNLIYISILIVTIIIIIIINGVRIISGIQHLNLADIMFNLFFLIAIILFEVLYLLKKQLNIKATYPMINKISKIGLYVILIVLIVTTISFNIFLSNPDSFRLLYTLTYILVQIISILLPFTLILNLAVQYLVKITY